MEDAFKFLKNNGSNSLGIVALLSALVFSLSAQELSHQSGLYYKDQCFWQMNSKMPIFKS